MSQFESEGVGEGAGTSVRFWTNTHQPDQDQHETTGAKFSAGSCDFIKVETETDTEMRSRSETAAAASAQDYLFNNCNNFTFISTGTTGDSCNGNLSNTNVTYFMSESDYFKLDYLRSSEHSETALASTATTADDETFSGNDDSIDQSTEFEFSPGLSVTDSAEPYPYQHQHNLFFEGTTQSESRFLVPGPGGSSTNFPAYICEIVEHKNDVVHRHNLVSQDNFCFHNSKSNSTPEDMKQVSRRRNTVITREVTSSEQPDPTPTLITVVLPEPGPKPIFRTHHHHHVNNNKRKSGVTERTRRKEQAVRLVSLKDLVPWLKGVPREKCSQITILNGAATYCQQLEVTETALMDQIQKEAARLHQNQQKLDEFKLLGVVLKVNK